MEGQNIGTFDNKPFQSQRSRWNKAGATEPDQQNWAFLSEIRCYSRFSTEPALKEPNWIVPQSVQDAFSNLDQKDNLSNQRVAEVRSVGNR